MFSRRRLGSLLVDRTLSVARFFHVTGDLEIFNHFFIFDPNQKLNDEKLLHLFLTFYSSASVIDLHTIVFKG